ncbi:MAG: aminoacyl-histidine dipeptidase [Clostridia bacterium]|nr:aminoacyl-histidine dipeptidase [Clostridia bacterium]
MSVLSGLEPEKVFKYFEEISMIPRGSGHTQKIAQYCMDFAAARALDAFCDESYNVTVFKGGSPGRENEAPVILQGHTDMVWEKEPGSDFDFENSPLRLKIEGDYISAHGTTLGGDDGAAVAICLALLDSSDISHPPLEVVFTSDEEIGMVGAFAYDAGRLRGKRMINLDSEAEDVLWVSCAGGARADIELPCVTRANPFDSYIIKISNLHGGHSGAEIDKGYANASVLMGRLLKALSDKYEIFISGVDGGAMDNAITRECTAVVCASGNIAPVIEKYADIFAAECVNDPGLTLDARRVNSPVCFDRESSDNIISMLSSFPCGVISMSKDIDGLVQTSLNLGITKTDMSGVSFSFLVRSSVNAEKEKLLDDLRSIASKYGASISVSGNYPAWEFNPESSLRKTMIGAYKRLFGKELKTAAIHAGLECGLFCGKIEGLDCVSIGPDMYDIHTPRERLSISSLKRVYDYLTETLKNI